MFKQSSDSASSSAATETKPEFIPLSEPYLPPDTWHHVEEALKSGWVSSAGPHIQAFEQAMASRLGLERTVATVNGTAALHIALVLAGVGPGDEVIVPTMTFIATLNAIHYTGATPVFWDSQQHHWNADPQKLEALVTPKTKAIMAVHLYGHPTPMDTVHEVANRHGLWIVEDAAEALASSWKGEPCGTMGRIGILSFNGNKMITTGGGGLIMSHNAELLEKAHYLINQAKDGALTFTHHEVGYNYRMTNMLAALGLAQLEVLDTILEKRSAIFRRYREAFATHPTFKTIDPPTGGTEAPWLLNGRIEADYATLLRLDPIQEHPSPAMALVHTLQEQQIQSRPFFKPGHLQRPYQGLGMPPGESPTATDPPSQMATSPFPHAESWYKLGISLPSSATLSDAQQERVIQAVFDAFDTPRP